MKKLKSRYVVEHIDSWIENNTLKFEEYSEPDSSYISSIFQLNLTFFEPKVIPIVNERTGLSMLARNFKKLFNSEK